jgi:capsular polysaccharide biosynthesis protein
LELSGYFAVLRRWWWTLIVAVWVAGLAGFVLGSQVAPTYETRIRLLVGPINTDIETLRAAGQLVQTYSELTTSQPLLESVSRELALPISTGELRSQIRSTADDVTRLLTIRVVDEDPERAVAIASTLGDELIQLAAGGTTRPEGELQTVDFPETPTDPIAPQMSLIVLLAALGGLVTAVVVVLLVEYVSDAVRGREDLERLIPAPFLGQATLEETATARTHRRLPTDGPSAATYRQALAKIERSRGGSAPMLAIFGPAGQPAVSDAVVAHAIAIAESSSRVVIVDVGGELSARLESTQAAGLRDWLLDPGRSVDALHVPLTRNVSFIPAGAGGAIEAITAEQVERLRELLLADPGVTLIVAGGSLDTTPAGIVPAAIADAVIVVAVRDRTHRTELRRMTETLRLIGARLAGSLLLVPGDRASRQRAAAVVPLEPATSSGVVGTPAERPVTVSSTRRRRRPG